MNDKTNSQFIIHNSSLKKGYKKTEIGVIPEDWEVMKLGEIVLSIASGKSNTKSQNGDFPIYGSTGIIGWKPYFDYEGEKNLVARVGANAGTINKVAGKYCVSDNTLMISYNKNSNIDFAFFQLTSLKLNMLVFGSGQPLITGGQLKNILTPLPPLPEQTAIAEVLSDTDELIQTLEKKITKKRLIKQGATQKLLTPKDDSTSDKSTADKWEVKKLGDFLQYEQPTKYIVDDTEYNDNYEIPVLTAGKSFILGYTNETEGIFNNCPVIIFDDFTTSSKYVNFSFKVKSSAMKILKPKNENVNLRFIFEIMQQIDFPLGDHKRHWIGEFQPLEIKIQKSKTEQNRIATILSDMDSGIEILVSKLAKYKKLKQGMMQELLTGKIRLMVNEQCGK